MGGEEGRVLRRPVGGRDQPEKRGPVPEVDGFDRQIDDRVDEKRGVRVKGERQRQQCCEVIPQAILSARCRGGRRKSR